MYKLYFPERYSSTSRACGINLLLVYSDVDGKNLVAIGFVELVAVQMESVSDTKGSMTLNFYFQKD